MLLALRRMLARWSISKVCRYSHLFTRIDAVHNRWQVAWENEAKQSFRPRAVFWLIYLGGLGELENFQGLIEFKT